MPHEDFTLRGYSDLIQRFRERGYRFVGFAQVQRDERHVILRHDVDLCVDRALKLAELEAELEVSSHYYFLLRTEMYNLFSVSNASKLARIAELGHDIGLHFDASLYTQDRNVLEKTAAVECRFLEDITGRAVTSISFHRPAPALQGLEGTLAGRLHTYEPRFFREIGYCSDSQGRWRLGQPLEHPAVEAGKALQLLTHPIWWTGWPGEPVLGKLNRWLFDQMEHRQNQLALNSTPYREYLRARTSDEALLARQGIPEDSKDDQ